MGRPHRPLWARAPARPSRAHPTYRRGCPREGSVLGGDAEQSSPRHGRGLDTCPRARSRSSSATGHAETQPPAGVGVRHRSCPTRRGQGTHLLPPDLTPRVTDAQGRLREPHPTPWAWGPPPLGPSTSLELKGQAGRAAGLAEGPGAPAQGPAHPPRHRRPRGGGAAPTGRDKWLSGAFPFIGARDSGHGHSRGARPPGADTNSVRATRPLLPARVRGWWRRGTRRGRCPHPHLVPRPGHGHGHRPG